MAGRPSAGEAIAPTRVVEPANFPRAVQLGVGGVLIALAILAWKITGDRMRGMDAGPGTDLGALGWFTGVWVVMMAAMMVPSTVPTILMDWRIRSGQRERGAAVAALGTTLFIGGYLVSWTAAGLVGYALLEAVRSLDIAFLSWEHGGRFVAASVLLAAALYELTRFKDACLSECRDPLAFLPQSWRSGAFAALRMGLAHGASCIGCCGALMAALFALGVMSIGWMALIAVLITAEKLLPWKTVATRGAVTVLLTLAIAVAVSPENVPGLTLPGRAGPMQAGDGMQDDP